MRVAAWSALICWHLIPACLIPPSLTCGAPVSSLSPFCLQLFLPPEQISLLPTSLPQHSSFQLLKCRSVFPSLISSQEITQQTKPKAPRCLVPDEEHQRRHEIAEKQAVLCPVFSMVFFPSVVLLL